MGPHVPESRKRSIPPAVVRTFRDAIPLVVDTVCFTPYEALGGRSLSQVIRFQQKEQRMVEEAAGRVCAPELCEHFGSRANTKVRSEDCKCRGRTRRIKCLWVRLRAAQAALSLQGHDQDDGSALLVQLEQFGLAQNTRK